MRLFIISIILLLTTDLWSQTELGIGLVSINFDDKTVLHLYDDQSAKHTTKTIEFFNDQSINSWNIKNLEKEKEWLKPEVLWLDYSAFTFRCKSMTEDWLEVIVNNENGKAYWLKKSELTIFNSWEAYLEEMFGIERLPDKSKKIRTSPNDNSDEINYQGQDCFVVKSMKGDWIEIMTPEYCDEDYTDSKTPIKNGWIKWKKGNELLINYFTTS